MENIKYYSKIEHDNEILEKLYSKTKNLEKDYPLHYKWFHEKFAKELDGIKREIIYYEIEDKIVGVIFLKKNLEEKKICTIIIDEEYRNLGIGTKLLEESFKFLETTKPLITMPDYKENCFKKIISKYEWKKTQIINECYSQNSEIVFNERLI